MRLWQYSFLVIQTYKTMADESEYKLVSKIGNKLIVVNNTLPSIQAETDKTE